MAVSMRVSFLKQIINVSQFALVRSTAFTLFHNDPDGSLATKVRMRSSEVEEEKFGKLHWRN